MPAVWSMASRHKRYHRHSLPNSALLATLYAILAAFGHHCPVPIVSMLPRIRAVSILADKRFIAAMTPHRSALVIKCLLAAVLLAGCTGPRSRATATAAQRAPTWDRSAVAPQSAATNAAAPRNGQPAAAATAQGAVQVAPAVNTVAFAEQISTTPADTSPSLQQVNLVEPVAPRAESTPPRAEVVEPPSPAPTYPIDLPTALRLADGSNLQVAVAREQIRQAWARADAARTLWLPSLRTGLNYNNHQGPIQAIDGSVFPVSRGAFYSGLGAGTVGAASPMVPGIYANFHLADALFQPLVTRQAAMARRHAAAAVTNDTLYRVSIGYLELMRAAEELAIAEQSAADANQLAELTASYAQSGQGLRADAERAATEAAIRKNDVLRAQEAIQVASARLAQVLRLDPTLQLKPLQDAVLPLELVPAEVPVGELVVQGLSSRPEIGENRHLVEQAIARMRRERYAALIPSVFVGTSYGAFGGGQNASISNFGGRFDTDAIAWWELRNMGFGDAAARAETRSLVRQANGNQLAVMDLVAREVVEANAQIVSRRGQITNAQHSVQAAESSHERNVARIRDVQGLPIEVLQSNQALAQARREYLRSVIDYNSAQFALYRALGWPGAPICLESDMAHEPETSQQ